MHGGVLKESKCRPADVAIIVPRVTLAMVVLMPPHRPLSEVIATTTFRSTSAAAADTQALSMMCPAQDCNTASSISQKGKHQLNVQPTRQVPKQREQWSCDAPRFLCGGLCHTHLGCSNHFHSFGDLLDVLHRPHLLLDCNKHAGVSPTAQLYGVRCDDSCSLCTCKLRGVFHIHGDGPAGK